MTLRELINKIDEGKLDYELNFRCASRYNEDTEEWEDKVEAVSDFVCSNINKQITLL